MQADATIQAISEQGDIPYDVITIIDSVDEYSITAITNFKAPICYNSKNEF